MDGTGGRRGVQQIERGGIDMAKTLVAFFSASGVTKKAAEKLAAAAGADLYEITPAVPYTKADLDWTDPRSRSSLEMKDPASRPEIAGSVEHMEAYDRIYLGFPIWWYIAPSIIHTFLESYDFSGKTILLFATSGGSGFGKTVQDLQSSVPDTVVIREGRMMNGRISGEELQRWIAQLG